MAAFTSDITRISITPRARNHRASCLSFLANGLCANVLTDMTARLRDSAAEIYPIDEKNVPNMPLEIVVTRRRFVVHALHQPSYRA
jgi:hypothetical protein